MGTTIGRLKIFFILVFLIAAGWLWIDQIYNVAPREACGEAGGWWSPELRLCKKPVSIRKYTGAKKPPPMDALRRAPSESANRPPLASEAGEAGKR